MSEKTMNKQQDAYKEMFMLLAKYIVVTRRAASCDVFDNSGEGEFSYWKGKYNMALEIETAADNIVAKYGLDDEVWGHLKDIDGAELLEIVGGEEK